MSDDRSAAGGSVPEWTHPGCGFGLPAHGPGSMASWGPRLLALLIDWALGNALAFALVRSTAMWEGGGWLIWMPLICWAVLVVLATGLSGASLGQRIMGLQIIRLDRQPVDLPTAVGRTALIALVIPPLVWNRDGRGLHDLAVGTAVVHGPN